MAFMPSNQCLWLLRQLTLFAWLYSLAHKKGTLHVQENVEKKLLVTDSYYFDGSKTFQLTLKPSSLNVVTHDFKFFQNDNTLRVLYVRDYKEWFLCVIYNLNGC